MKTVKTLDVLALEIKEQLGLSYVHVKQGLEHARAVGEGLLAAKEMVNELLAYGSWTKWLQDNFAMSQVSASNFMRLAKNWSKIKTEGFGSISMALKFLRDSSGKKRTRKAKEAPVTAAPVVVPTIPVSFIVTINMTQADYERRVSGQKVWVTFNKGGSLIEGDATEFTMEKEENVTLAA